ncbi:MAG: hypothetical protein ABW185_13430 [Sedimenticola sp.]
MKHSDIKDVKWLAKTYCPNMKVATGGDRVQWRRIKWIQVRKQYPESVFFNYNFDEENFMEVRVAATTRKRGRQQKSWPNTIPGRYTGKQPITLAKKNDLMSLCVSQIIPEEHHTYYANLETSSNAKDKIPIVQASDLDTDDE